ncbi:hypothetical protein [Pseudoalteromonas phage KB12-38]|nr:hypothetical protein [Pseudoalteromonas phage KB12-38]
MSHEHMKINNVSFDLKIESNDSAMRSDPKTELLRLLKETVEKVENDDEFGDCYDLNGNNAGFWLFEVEGEDWPTEREAIDQFKAHLTEMGRDFYDEHDRDETALAQEWSAWVDTRLTEEEFPPECTGWSYD